MAKFRITFNVMGHVTQEVEIPDEKMTRVRLKNMLESGKYVTTIQEDGSIDCISTGKIIGKVISVDNECSYEDFDVEKG